MRTNVKFVRIFFGYIKKNMYLCVLNLGCIWQNQQMLS